MEKQHSKSTPTNGPNPEFINLSAYKFVDLNDLENRRTAILNVSRELDLKGTVLLSPEGINLFVAGERPKVQRWLEFLYQTPEYTDLPIKESLSNHQPFSRMLVRIKKEIITFGVEGIQPQKRTSPKLSAEQLKQWLDAGKEITLLDVRNDYEVDLGTFDRATRIGVDHFRQFPDAVQTLPDDLKTKPLVMFCTGGIRCEKAGPFMEQEGFEEIYQLDGGILRYFEECGGDHYTGECFVFDKRVAVDPDLRETATEQCFACQHPLTAKEQESERYQPGQCCPHCYRSPEEIMRERIMIRQAAVNQLTLTLPGSQPYDNQRPLNVPARYDQFSVIDFLTAYHPHVPRSRWVEEIVESRIQYQGKPVVESKLLRAGMRLDHLIPETVEPDVSADIEILFEDDDLVVVSKPAPLPMHPCGRFNRNSLIYMIDQAFPGEKIRMAHRLDANTSGCVILCRKKAICQDLHRQFESGRVKKRYLARVLGQPNWTHHTSLDRISTEPATAGVRQIDPEGLSAETDFEKISEFEDGTSLIQCIPKTGRTNQIRIHLWHLGFPIQGDPVFLPSRQLGSKQTLDVGSPPMCLHALQVEFEHPRLKQSVSIQTESPIWCSIPTA